MAANCGGRSQWLVYLTGAALFAVTYWLWNLPVAMHPAAVLRGWEGDNLYFTWNLWWVSHCVWGEDSVFFCRYVFYPDGHPFFFSTHTWLYGMVDAILPSGPVLSYNLLCLFSTVLTGVGAMALASAAGARTAVGKIVAGLMVAFCHQRLFSLYGHLNLVGTEFLVWSLWAHVLAWRDGSARHWALGGLFAGLAFLNDLTYGIFALLFWMYASGWSPWKRRPARMAELATPLLSPAVVLLVAGWTFVPLVQVFLSDRYVVPDLHQIRNTDLLNLWLPGDYHAVTGPHTFALRQRFAIPGGDGVAFWGWPALAALVVGAFILPWRQLIRRSDVRFWGGLLALAIMMTLGEWLTIGGVKAIPIPPRILREVPILNNIRIPARYTIFIAITLALFTARLVDHICARSRRSGVLFLTLLSGLFLFDIVYMIPVTHVDAEPVKLPQEILEPLRAEGEGSVWDLPCSWDENLFLYWGTQHGRPLVFGRTARPSPKMMEEWPAAFPFLRGLQRKNTPTIESAVAAAGSEELLAEQMKAFARAHDVRFVLVDTEECPEGEELVRRFLGGAEVQGRAGRFVVFEVSRQGNPSHQ